MRLAWMPPLEQMSKPEKCERVLKVERLEQMDSLSLFTESRGSA
jgi:hypothetical protein